MLRLAQPGCLVVVASSQRISDALRDFRTLAVLGYVRKVRHVVWRRCF